MQAHQYCIAKEIMISNLIKKIESHFYEKLPFVVFSLPGSNLLSVFLQHNAALTKVVNFKEQGFVFAPFVGDAYYLSAADSDYYECDFDLVEYDFQFVEPSVIGADKNAFVELVQKGIKTINEGSFEKVVLARQELVELPSNDIKPIIERLLKSDITAFRYCFYSSETGLWMGASPEKLISINGGVLTTMALAGTQKFNNADVEWQQKEKDEQQYVADYISEVLKSVDLEPEASDRYTARAGNLMHLRTDIKCEIKHDTNIAEIITKFHPTPAVCGLPKLAAKEFILCAEAEPREFYSGYLGLMNITPQTIDLYVNLRCMKIEEGIARLYIGCGITSESIPEKEFEETVNKSHAMKRVLG